MEQLRGVPQLVAENIENFTGRTWLLPHLTAWNEDPDNSIMFMLTSEPGAGKTSVVAWLAGMGPEISNTENLEELGQFRSQVKAVYFCTARERGTLSPQSFSKRMAEQLASTVEGFAETLLECLPPNQVQINVTQQIRRMEGGLVTAIKIDHLDLSNLNADESFNSAIREPLKMLFEKGRAETIVLIIDALDEAHTYAGEFKIPQLLSGIADLPPNVRVLVTTRPDPRVTKFFPHAKRLDLIDDAPTDIDDVEQYALGFLPAHLEGVYREKAASKLSQAAQGNFLYAFLVLRNWAPQLSPTAWEYIKFPKGLSGLYHEFLNRELGADENKWASVYEPLLGLIAISQGDGLTRMRIDTALGQNMRHPLRACAQYLNSKGNEGPFRIFHQSFTDFLLEDESNTDYRVELSTQQELHAKLLDSYNVDEWWELPVDEPYMWDHLIYHLLGTQRINQLEKLFEDSNWYHARFAADGYDFSGYVNDLVTTWETTAQRELLHQIKNRLTPTKLIQSVRYLLIRTTINSIASGYTPDIVKRAVETEFWTAEQALGTAKLVPDPYARARVYASILGTKLLTEEQSRQACQKAIDATRTIRDWNQQVGALWELGPFLNNEFLQQAFDIANSLPKIIRPFPFDDEAQSDQQEDFFHEKLIYSYMIDQPKSPRAQAIGVLAKHLKGSLFHEALEAAMELPEELLPTGKSIVNHPQLFVLGALASGIAGAESDQVEVIENILKITDEQKRLLAILPFIPSFRIDVLHSHAKHILNSFKDQDLRNTAYTHLSIRLLKDVPEPDEGFSTILNELLQEPDEWFRAASVVSLAPRLTDDLLVTAIDGLCKTEHEELRYPGISTLLKSLSQTFDVNPVLNLAKETRDEKLIHRILTILGPQLTESQAVLAWEISKKMSTDQLRAEAQVALCQSIPDSFVPNALNTALSTTGGTRRSEGAIQWTTTDRSLGAMILGALATRLTDDLASEALIKIFEIDNKAWHAKALIALAPRLSNRLFTEVREQIEALPNEEYQMVVAALPVHDSKAYIHTVLRSQLAIKDYSETAHALSVLVSALSEPDETLIDDTFDIIARVIDLKGGMQAFLKIAKLLPSKLMPKALQITDSISDKIEQAKVFATLFPITPSEFQEQLINAILPARPALLETALSAYPGDLSEQLLAQLLNRAAKQGKEWDKFQILKAIFPRLKDDLLERGLQVLYDLKKDGDRLALICLIDKDALKKRYRDAFLQSAEKYPDDQLTSGADEIENNYLYARHVERVINTFTITSALVTPEGRRHFAILRTFLEKGDDNIPEDTFQFWEQANAGALSRALQAVLKMEDARLRGLILETVSEKIVKMPSPELERILDEEYHHPEAIDALVDVVKYLDQEHKQRTLSDALERIIADDQRTMGVDDKKLSYIAPHLSDTQMKRALYYALSQEDTDQVPNWYRLPGASLMPPTYQGNPRARALGALAPGLRNDLLQQAFGAALDIKTEDWRAYVIAQLAPQLTFDLLERAIDTVSDFEEDESIYFALSGLAPYLKDELRKKGKNLALQIKDYGLRAGTIRAFLDMESDQQAVLFDIYEALANQLLALQTLPRSAALNFLTWDVLFSSSLFPEEEVLREICGQILDIRRKWDWEPATVLRA